MSGNTFVARPGSDIVRSHQAKEIVDMIIRQSSTILIGSTFRIDGCEMRKRGPSMHISGYFTDLELVS